MKNIRPEDKPVLIALAKNGCSFGDTLSELADATGYTVQRLASVAKRYDGQKLGRLKVTYIGPDNTTFKSVCPGIKNPRSGIAARIPATISVEYRNGKNQQTNHGANYENYPNHENTTDDSR